MTELLWVTNVPTPYRAPLWSALGEERDLTVALLADSEENRSWKVDLDTSRFDVVSLNARTLGHFGDATIYGPSRQLLSLIADRPAAVVLDGWESPAFLTARWWASRLEIPVIASYRSTLTTHRFRSGPVPMLRRWFFRGAQAVLTAGEASSDAVRSMGVPQQRIAEGFNTVDVERFALGARRWRTDHPGGTGHRFLYVGQLIARKNVGALLASFAAVRAPDDTLTIVGTGALLADLRQAAQALGIADQVRFIGHLDGDDLVAAYAAADTFVLPSTTEVWGLVVNEALAAGLHAVVSNRCGIVPSIEGMPGVLACPPTVEGLAAALGTSRETWAGPITDHPITHHTPQALAQVVLQSLPTSAQGTRRRG